MFIYHRRPDGAVLASLEARDPAYEKSLERSGIEYDVTKVPNKDAPAADQLQRATMRGGQVQLDREGTVH